MVIIENIRLTGTVSLDCATIIFIVFLPYVVMAAMTFPSTQLFYLGKIEFGLVSQVIPDGSLGIMTPVVQRLYA